MAEAYHCTDSCRLIPATPQVARLGFSPLRRRFGEFRARWLRRVHSSLAMGGVINVSAPYHLMEDAIIPPARVIPSGRTLVPPRAAANSGLFLCPRELILMRYKSAVHAEPGPGAVF
jgi:hypothetical protein